MSSDTSVMPRGFAVVTVSSTHPAECDESGPIVREALVAAGHRLVHQRWLVDDLSNIRYLFREWVDDPRVHVVVSIGGTGIQASDITPEALGPLITKQMPGFGEIFRMLAFAELGITALETRALAAVCHSTLVYALPGAPQAVTLAVRRLIVPQLSARIATDDLRPTMMPRMGTPRSGPPTSAP